MHLHLQQAEPIAGADCDSIQRMSLASLLYHALVDHPAFKLVPKYPGSPAPHSA